MTVISTKDSRKWGVCLRVCMLRDGGEISHKIIIYSINPFEVTLSEKIEEVRYLPPCVLVQVSGDICHEVSSY